MTTSPHTVMIVEDEPLLQDVYKLVLEAKGYNVVTADNGQEALQKIKQTNPHVILLDMLMPVMGGKEFMHSIHLEDYPQTKIFIYSNLSDSAIEAEMLELGAHRFVLKSSMTPQAMVDMIQAA